MQDNIPDALIAAFERHYDCPWNEPTLRNERLAWRAAWAAAMDSKQCLLQITEPQAVPAAVAVADERAAFEDFWRREMNSEVMDLHKTDFPFTSPEKQQYSCHETNRSWLTWQARAALAATPAAAPVVRHEPADDSLSLMLQRLDSKSLAEWADVGMGLAENIALHVQGDCNLRADQARQKLRAHLFSLQPAVSLSSALLATGREAQAQQPAIMPKGESAAAQLRAMATNYPTGHSWDKLDAKACIRGALEIEALRALLATATGLPAQAVEPDEWYCEDHPEHKMGHDGCKGAGVLESCRLGLQTRHLRFAKQDAREAEKMRDEMASHARRLASDLSKRSEDAELFSWLCDSEKIYWIHIQAEPDRRDIFNSSMVGNLRASIRAAIAAAKGD